MEKQIIVPSTLLNLFNSKKKSTKKEKNMTKKEPTKRKRSENNEPKEKKPRKKKAVEDQPKTATADEEDQPKAKKPRTFFDAGKYQQKLEALNPGCKDIPVGKDYCLDKKAFVITGALESMSRTEVIDLIKQYGGLVRTTVSSKTNYILVGQDSAAGKLEKAEKHKTKQITEDELLQMIADSNVVD